MTPPRVLIAGFGNELRSDDGFGLRVLEALAPLVEPHQHVELFAVGTGGLRLAQQLLDAYDHLVIVDAMRRGGAPGTLYVLEVDEVTGTDRVDLHLATPARALSVARQLGALPPRVHMVGCEAAEVDELSMELTSAVAAAIPGAVEAVLELLVSSGAGVVGTADAGHDGHDGEPGAGR